MTTSKKLRDMKLPPGYNDCLLLDAAYEIDRLTRERDEAWAEREALRAACKTTLMLRQLGGMMPGTKAVIDVAIHHAEEALAQIEQERSEQKGGA